MVSLMSGAIYKTNTHCHTASSRGHRTVTKMTKLFALLLLTLTIIRGDTYKCQRHKTSPMDPVGRLQNCGGDKRFVMTKTNHHYKLKLCTSLSHCTTRNHIFIECDDVCDFCEKLPVSAIRDCSDNRMCERSVDRYLNDYCANATFPQNAACSTSPTLPITPTPCTSSEPVPMVTVTVSKTITVTSNASIQAPATPALGAMIGLLLLILAMVLTGWVWTCWTMKKRSNKTHLCTKCQDCQEKRSYPNPTYGMTTETQPAVDATTQHHSREVGNGQIHNTLSRGDNQDVQGTGEGESGEKHVYHVLEKPGGDDYEDPDKDLEENMVMEYEIPVPLKET